MRTRCCASCPTKDKVVVEGINRVYKHVKPNRRNPQGGRLSKEMPIDVSNVLLFCPTCRRGVRIGRRYDDDGAQGTLLQEVRRRPRRDQQGPAEVRQENDASRRDRDGREVLLLARRERVMARLLDRYQKEIVPALAKKLGRENVLSLPRLQKIVVNMGVGKALQDKNRMEQAAEQLTQITGQKAQITQGARSRSAASASARATRSAAG